MHLAELSGGILAQFCFSITVGEDRFSWLIVGDEGSLRIPDSGTVVVRQRHDDDQPVECSRPMPWRLGPASLRRDLGGSGQPRWDWVVR
jgi:hypothetical protein